MDYKLIKITRDAGRIVDAKLSIILWTAQLEGKKIFSSPYNPQERIDLYETRFTTYCRYLFNAIQEGTPIEDIINTLEDIIKSIGGFIPKEIQQMVLKEIADYLKEIVGNLLKGK